MSELSAGVRALLGRMESNPDEFYGDASKWAFMFAANFRDVMTEPEKGALHEGLKNVRRKEFDELVMRRILRDEENEKMEQMRASATGITTASYNALSHAAGQGLLGSYHTTTRNPFV